MLLKEVLNLVNAGFSKDDIEKLQNDSPSAVTQNATTETNKTVVEPNEHVENKSAFDYKALAMAMVEAQQEYNRATDYSRNNPKSDIGKLF